MEITREMLIKEFIGKENMDEKMECVMYPIEFVTEITDNMEFVSTSDSLGFPFSIYKEKKGDCLFGYIDYPEDWFSDEDDEEEEEMDINKAKEVEIEDVDGLKEIICPTCGYAFLPNDRCPNCGQLIKVKENEKTELNYVMKEKVASDCWSSVVDWFWNQFCCNTTDRIQLLKAIDDAIFKNPNQTTDEDTDIFFCFDTELDNVDSTDELHIMENTPDKYYKKAFRATLDEYGNPALFEIEITKESTMLERILRTVSDYFEIDHEFMDENKVKNIKEQIEWLKEQLKKEDN